MKQRMRTKPAVVIHSVNARCLDLEEFSGFFGRRKKNRLYESAMMDISEKVMDLFGDVETFSFTMTEEGFHFLIWSGRDRNRVARVLIYVQSRFSEMVNRSLGRTGPVWDGTWSCDVIDDPEG